MMKQDDAELALMEKARAVLPGGGFGNLGFDVVISEGRAGHVWDASGNEYIDYLLGSGPMLIGHGHPDVLAAVEAQIPRGTTFFANNESGILLAEEIVDAMACADKVRFEPFQRLIKPQPGFLEALRKVTTECGIALIFDEVVTGFRLAYGGAQAYYGVVPDMCALGKVIGGGFPLSAIAGRDEYMAHFDKAKVAEDEYMPQIGTLSGNPVSAAAGLATMQVLKQPGSYEKIHANGQALMDGLTELFAKTGVPAKVVGEPPLFDVFFTDGEIRDYRTMVNVDRERVLQFNRLIRARGVFKGDSKFYISLAHTGEDIAFTLDVFASALDEMLASAA
jgi:glutamate-1-semialdehyde aminotransferase